MNMLDSDLEPRTLNNERSVRVHPPEMASDTDGKAKLKDDAEAEEPKPKIASGAKRS